MPDYNQALQKSNSSLQSILSVVNAMSDVPAYDEWVFELENGSTVTKKICRSTITFTIDGTSYTASEGMTWEEWCNSSYNSSDFRTINTDVLIWGSGTAAYIKNVVKTDVITNGTAYISIIDGSTPLG